MHSDDKKGQVLEMKNFKHPRKTRADGSPAELSENQEIPRVVDGAKKEEFQWADPKTFDTGKVKVTVLSTGGKTIEYDATKSPELSGAEFLLQEMQKLVERKDDLLIRLRAGHPVRFMIDEVWVECRPIYKFAAGPTGTPEAKVEVSLPWYWKLWGWLNSFVRNEDNESNSKKSEAKNPD